MNFEKRKEVKGRDGGMGRGVKGEMGNSTRGFQRSKNPSKTLFSLNFYAL